MAVVNELVTKFVFEGSLKPIKDFQQDLRDSIITIGKYGAALGAATVAGITWTDSVLRGSESLVRLQQDTDLTIKELQQLQFITAQNGLEVESFADNILSLSEKIGEAAATGQPDFEDLGISVKGVNGEVKTTTEILTELNNKFKTLSKAEQINFARKLGVDQKLITAFDKTDEELTNLIKKSEQFGLVTEEQTKQLDEYFKSTETLKFGLTAISRQIALDFAPTLTSLSNNITDFLAEYGSTFSKVFSEFFDGIGNLIGAFNSLIKNTIGWKTVLVGLGAAALVAFPATAIIGGITLIIAVVEDLIVAFQGGESTIKNIALFTKDLVLSIVKDLKTLATDGIDFIIGKFKQLLDFLNNTFVTPINNAFTDIGAFLGFTTGTTVGALAPGTNSTTNNSTFNNEVSIFIKDSNNPLQTVEVIDNYLRTELGQANFQYGKGGQ